MANTTAVYARIDTDLKDSAEAILGQLGITPSSAIQMFYSQIILSKGIPFNLTLSGRRPTAIGGMNKEELDAEIQKGIDSIDMAPSYTVDEVRADLHRKFGI